MHFMLWMLFTDVICDMRNFYVSAKNGATLLSYKNFCKFLSIIHIILILYYNISKRSIYLYYIYIVYIYLNKVYHVFVIYCYFLYCLFTPASPYICISTRVYIIRFQFVLHSYLTSDCGNYNR